MPCFAAAASGRSAHIPSSFTRLPLADAHVTVEVTRVEQWSRDPPPLPLDASAGALAPPPPGGGALPAGLGLGLGGEVDPPPRAPAQDPHVLFLPMDGDGREMEQWSGRRRRLLIVGVDIHHAVTFWDPADLPAAQRLADSLASGAPWISAFYPYQTVAVTAVTLDGVPVPAAA